MRRLDAFATERHFLDHIVPVWHALPEHARGRFVTPPAMVQHAVSRGITPVSKLTPGAPLLVAGFGDMRRQPAVHDIVYMEHGSGQSYGNGHTSYVGGPQRERVRLFLCPSERVAQSNRLAWPAAVCVAVGSPRVDRWMDHRPGNAEPVVAISFHWDCKVAPESRWAWPFYYPALRYLARAFPGRVLGHAHPRTFSTLRHPYRTLGIEPVEDFEEIMARADLYAVDNSSTLFEFAATGRPVAVLNQPSYRRDVDFWPRFWWGADVGYNIDHPSNLASGIRAALDDGPMRAALRAKISSEVYAHLGHASEAAAEAITGWLEDA